MWGTLVLKESHGLGVRSDRLAPNGTVLSKGVSAIPT